MATRWPVCTQAWTCRSTTGEISFVDHNAVAQSRGISSLPGASWRAGVERLSRTARRQPCGRDYALHRKVDADVPSDHAFGNSSAEAHEFTVVGSLSPHAGPVCVLLRHLAFDDFC